MVMVVLRFRVGLAVSLRSLVLIMRFFMLSLFALMMLIVVPMRFAFVLLFTAMLTLVVLSMVIFFMIAFATFSRMVPFFLFPAPLVKTLVFLMLFAMRLTRITRTAKSNRNSHHERRNAQPLNNAKKLIHIEILTLSI